MNIVRITTQPGSLIDGTVCIRVDSTSVVELVKYEETDSLVCTVNKHNGAVSSCDGESLDTITAHLDKFTDFTLLHTLSPV